MIKLNLAIVRPDADTPPHIGVGMQIGAPGTEFAATVEEKEVLARIMAEVQGINTYFSTLVQMKAGPGVAPSLIVPPGAGKLSTPH